MKYLSISLLFLIAMCQKDDEETCLIDQPDLNVVCIEIYQPVCGCDKVTYSNNCYASCKRCFKLGRWRMCRLNHNRHITFL